MKPKLSLLMALLPVIFGLLLINFASAQLLTDSTVNYYTLTAYYDHYYDSLLLLKGPENMQGTGYKDYQRWKWFYCQRHGVEGDLGAVWEGINGYHINNYLPEGYTDESDWHFVGPYGIPLRHSDNPSATTGKGMMISLWVDDGDHSLMYAGSHHGGLWKTADGGDNWFPLHDNDSRIHGVNSIAVDPDDHQTIYILSNNSLAEASIYNAGLFKSVDGGLNWEMINTSPYENYPTAYWGSEVRKIILDPDNPDILYFINYRNVYKSMDQGASWQKIFFKNYFPWGNKPSYFEYHNGLFDFKITPWNNNIAYLAGSEVFEITESQEIYDTTNLSDKIFLIGLNPEDYMINHPHRTAISLDARFPEKVWFCYVADYHRNGFDTTYMRIVKYTPTDNFSLLYDDPDVTGASANKLVFSVSPSDNSVFYMGGISLIKLDLHVPQHLESIVDGLYPDPCWMHVDLRDLVLFSDGNGHDTLYLANDGGISWGTSYAPGPGCGSGSWHWRHPCTSLINGLNVTEFFGLGISESRPDLMAGGCQDLNDMLLDGDKWINFGTGDGGGDMIFDPIYPDTIYFYEWQSGTIFRSPNLGESKSSVFTGAGTYVMTPIILDPIDNSIMYSGNTNLLKFTDVNNFDQSVPDPELLASFNYGISDIEVVKSGLPSKIFYVATLKSYDTSPPPSSDFIECIYRSDDGIVFNDLSQGLDGCRYGYVAYIEVNPYNPDQVWVACAKYSKGYQRSKVFTLNSPGNTWQDISMGLPDGMPVFKITYIPQLGRLLACCDVGIFKRDPQDTQWYPYENNLPMKIITDMKVNKPFHKVVASSFGRGIWETELQNYCFNTDPPLHIEEHVIWTEEHLLKGSIVIDSGATLEIKHCGVFMPENARIRVRQGGKLIVDGGTITSACPDPWNGIEVWGSDTNQYFTQYFGQVFLRNNAVIENARIALSNYCIDCEYYYFSGGIIYSDNAIFRNNQIAVDFAPFKNMYNGKEYPYHAPFTNCRFETTSDLPGNLEFKYFIRMAQVNGVRVYGCDFINEMGLTGSAGELANKFKSGIYSLGAQFFIDETCLDPTISPCQSFKPSYFYGLNYGIYAMGIDPVYTVTVNKSEFRDNNTGIYINDIENATVTLNDFYVNKKYPGSLYDTYVGLYLDFCTRFTVEENYFSQENYDVFHNAGIVVKDAGEEHNEIYNNFFTNPFEAGIMALNKNRNRDGDKGLVIKCNEFGFHEQFKYCILVEEEGEVTENSGIAIYQGSNESPSSPAGNLFSRHPYPLLWDYCNSITKNLFTYFMHEPSSEPRVEPYNYTDETITLYNTGFIFEREECCPSNLLNPGPGPGVLRTEMTFTELKIDSAMNDLNVWMDGGNTSQVISDITFSAPPEAYELYSDLILKSPYLSDTVLKESIQKEEVLNNVMIEGIMVANPQSAKSSEIQETLDNKYFPLTGDQRQTIDQGKFIVSPLENLESRVAHY